MKTRSVVFLLQLIIFYCSVAQPHQYIWKNFTPETGRYYGSGERYPDYLGKILIQGYLQGKLKAYRFSLKDTVYKWQKVDSSSLPREWDPYHEYFETDRVLYKNKTYECIGYGTKKSPDSSDDWVFYEHRSPLSQGKIFPSKKDTLTRSRFALNMIARLGYQQRDWESNMTYFPAEMVSYRGRFYEAEMEVTGLNPAENPDYWRLTNSGNTVLGSIKDLRAYTVLFHYQLLNGDTVWTPQIVKVGLTLEDRDPEVASFKFDDVIQYLKSIKQPVINSGFNHLGEYEMILSGVEKQKFLLALQAFLKKNYKQISQKSILIESLFNDFLNDTSAMVEEWGGSLALFQDPMNKSINLSKASMEVGYTPILHLPLAVLKKSCVGCFMAVANPQRFSDGLSNKNFFRINFNEPWVDSLAPLSRAAETQSSAIKKSYSFVERYAANFLELPESLQPQVANLSMLIKREYNSGKIEIQEDYPYFNDNMNWVTDKTIATVIAHTKTPISWSDFPRDNTQRIDLKLEGEIEISEIQVHYQRFAGSKDSQPPVPVKITIVAKTGDNSQVGFPFSWPEVKRLMLNSGKDFKALIQSIEKGSLPFRTSVLINGLRE